MSDALQHPPSFDEMVGLIKKLHSDYLEDVLKSSQEQIEKSWERYKTLNHLYLDEKQPGVACEPDFIEFIKNERQAIIKAMYADEWWLTIPAERRVVIENILIAYDQMVSRLSEGRKTGPVWVKASERLPGWDELVEWRFAGKEPTAKETVRFLSSAANIHQWEWYDEAAPSGEREVAFAEWLDITRNSNNEIWKDMSIWGKEDAFKLVYELFKQKPQP